MNRERNISAIIQNVFRVFHKNQPVLGMNSPNIRSGIKTGRTMKRVRRQFHVIFVVAFTHPEMECRNTRRTLVR